VVDAAMTDGVMSLFGVYYAMAGTEHHDDEALGTNFFDGGSPSYNVYPTSDGRYVAVAPIEDRFYEEMLRRLEIDPATLPDRHDPAHWDELIATFTAVFRTRTRAEWEEVFDGTDACVTGVHTFSEARELPLHVARGVFRSTPEGDLELAPVPRLSRTPGRPGPSYAHPGADTDAVLGELGLDVPGLRAAGAVR
jgi:alpha-methylacyl-CoA racemase